MTNALTQFIQEMQTITQKDHGKISAAVVYYYLTNTALVPTNCCHCCADYLANYLNNCNAFISEPEQYLNSTSFLKSLRYQHAHLDPQDTANTNLLSLIIASLERAAPEPAPAPTVEQ